MAKRILKHVRIRDMLLAEAERTGSDLLPSERDIAASYGVSRMTARKALDSLAREKLARREVGKGTFLIRKPRKKRINVAILCGPREHPAMVEKLAGLYMKKNPGLEVCLLECYEKNWYSMILEHPGAKVLLHSHFGYLADMGVLLPIDGMEGFVETQTSLVRQHSESHKGLDGREHCFSLPLYYTPTIFGYNRRFARLLGLDHENGPKSWDELLEWARLGSRVPGVGDVYATELRYGSRVPISFYLTLTGGTHYLRHGAGGGVEFDFSGGEEWFALFSKISSLGTSLMNDDEGISPLVRGRCLFSCMIEPWIFRQAKEFGTRDDMAVCPVPPPKRGMPSFSRVNAWGCSLVKDESVNEDEVRAGWDFMRFMAEDVEAQQIICSALPGFSVLEELYLEQQKNPDWYPFMLAMATGRKACDLPIQHTINSVVNKYMGSVVFDGMAAAEAAEDVVKICTTLVDIGNDTGAIPGVNDYKIA